MSVASARRPSRAARSHSEPARPYKNSTCLEAQLACWRLALLLLASEARPRLEQPAPHWVHAWLRRGWTAQYDGRDASAAFESLTRSQTREWLADNPQLLQNRLTPKMVETLEALLDADTEPHPVSRGILSARLGGRVTAGNLVNRLHAIEKRLDDCPPVSGLYPATRIRLLVANAGEDCKPAKEEGRWSPRARTAAQFYRLGVDHLKDGEWRWGLAHPYCRATNLLRRFDAYVSRPGLEAKLESALDSSSLVSLVGFGGIGKTRLAVHYALGPRRPYRIGGGGVWFIDLSRATDLADVLHALVSTLSLRLQTDGGGASEQLARVLSRRGQTLLVLDNLEQVIETVLPLVRLLLRMADNLRILVTSREPVGLSGEFVLEVPVMDLSDAVALFSCRAAAASPAGQREEDLPVIEALVDELDRLPLAIELAAARAGTFGPNTLLAMMSNRFRLLTSKRGRVDRHARLLATLDWSWELLSEEEQSGLAQLSVFKGGFSLDAMEAVLDVGEAWVPDVLAALVLKSLVQVVEEERYDLLVCVQAYAAQKLSELDSVESVSARHGAYFTRFGTMMAIDGLAAHGGVARWHGLRKDLDNLLVAVQRATTRGDTSAAVSNALAAQAIIMSTGPGGADVRCLRLALSTFDRHDQRCDADIALLHLRALVALGHGTRRLGKTTEARSYLDEALREARALGNRHHEGIILGSLGRMFVDLGQLGEAQSLYEGALAVHREIGNRRQEGVVLNGLANLHIVQGLPEEARLLLEGALAVHREVGNRCQEGVALGGLAILHRKQNWPEAQSYFEDALVVHRAAGDRHNEGVTLGNLGSLHLGQGQVEQARLVYEGALAVHREVGNQHSEGVVLANLGNLSLEEGRLDVALPYLESALVVHREVGDRRTEAISQGNLGELHRRRGDYVRSRRALRQAISLFEAARSSVGVGSCLGSLAELDAAEGDTQSADRHAARALDLLPPNTVELGVLRCRLARIALGHSDATAQLHLAQAEAIAEHVGASSGLGLRRAIAELHERLGAPDMSQAGPHLSGG